METDDELSEYLASLAREECYRVASVYRRGKLETTEQVFFVGRNGSELGPFVRKSLSKEAGLGGAYETLFSAQRQGARLPHLPRIIECYRRDDKLVVVMEHVQGETLEQLVAQAPDAEKRLELARSVFPDLCDAVSELHEKLSPAVIHRDLKPSNVMVAQGNVTLIDLGIARTFKEGGEQDTTHFGTRAYAPPEQFGFGQTDVRSDVYALGMLLFFCLTGRDPTAEAREQEFAEAGLPERVRDVIVAATQLDPAGRPATVRELKELVLRALDGEAAGEGARAQTQAKPEAETAPAASSLLSGIASWLSRIPGWVGFVWNVCAGLAEMLILASCVRAFQLALEGPSDLPVWYNAVVLLVFVPALTLIGVYLVLDRRPLRRHIPALARLTIRQELRWALVITMALIAAMFILTLPIVW